MNYKDEINKRGLKITWIATKVGITRSLLSQYVNGARSMPKHIDKKLREILK
jgi:predicted transcriptional regulator